MPDIQNCIAMSKALGISMAELLELETEEQEPAAELTEQHLVLVEKMIQEYDSARKRLVKRWRWPAIVLTCAMLVGAAFIWEWLNEMSRTVDYLSGELAGMQGQIISGVGDRLDESLEAERSLVSNFTADRISADLESDTITYQIRVNLKERTTDTTVSFLSRINGNPEITTAQPDGGLSYIATVTCPIMDEPVAELLVERDGITRSQSFSLDCYKSDYSIRLTGEVRWAALQNTGLTNGAVEPVEVFCAHDHGFGLSEALRVTDLEICIFRNDSIIGQIPLDFSAGQTGAAKDWHYHCEYDIPVPTEAMQKGDTLTFALLARDNYDRETTTIISRYLVLEDGMVESLAGERIAIDDGTYGTEEWE